MTDHKIVNGLREAVRYENAISSVYKVIEKYPKYALTQMNDHLAAEIVEAVRTALALPNGNSETQ